MPLTLVATRYEILKGVRVTSFAVAAKLPEKPHRVAVLLNPEEFAKTSVMSHGRNVFIDERLHDWDWSNGDFKYYSHAVEVDGVVDVVVVYEAEWREL